MRCKDGKKREEVGNRRDGKYVSEGDLRSCEREIETPTPSSKPATLAKNIETMMQLRREPEFFQHRHTGNTEGNTGNETYLLASLQVIKALLASAKMKT